MNASFLSWVISFVTVFRVVQSSDLEINTDIHFEEDLEGKDKQKDSSEGEFFPEKVAGSP